MKFQVDKLSNKWFKTTHNFETEMCSDVNEKVYDGKRFIFSLEFSNNFFSLKSILSRSQNLEDYVQFLLG